MSALEVVADILEHHGVKGMRWGVRRKATVGPQEVIISDKRKKIKTSGGGGHPAHPDAVKVRTIGQKGKKSGLKSLSDQELNDYARRIQLEQNVKRLQYNEKSKAHRFVLAAVGRSANQNVDSLAKTGSAAVGKKALKLAAAAA